MIQTPPIIPREEVTPKWARRERRLEDGIIDGTPTPWVQVPDLRVGAVVHQASQRMRRSCGSAQRRTGTKASPP